jgi:hypothetical protein
MRLPCAPGGRTRLGAEVKTRLEEARHAFPCQFVLRCMS